MRALITVETEVTTAVSRGKAGNLLGGAGQAGSCATGHGGGTGQDRQLCLQRKRAVGWHELELPGLRLHEDSESGPLSTA